MTVIIMDPPKVLEPGLWKSGVASPLHMSLQRIGRELASFAYRYGCETGLHESLAHVLTQAGFEFQREHILDKANRLDFFLPPTGIAIEVKIGGSLSEALRQVDRYLHHDDVTAVLLASTARWADMPTKERLAWQDKPFHMVRLRRQTL